jgi:hypothetical protein
MHALLQDHATRRFSAEFGSRFGEFVNRGNPSTSLTSGDVLGRGGWPQVEATLRVPARLNRDCFVPAPRCWDA